MTERSCDTTKTDLLDKSAMNGDATSVEAKSVADMAENRALCVLVLSPESKRRAVHGGYDSCHTSAYCQS